MRYTRPLGLLVVASALFSFVRRAEAPDHDPGAAIAHLRLARVAREAGDFDVAVREISIAVQLDSGSVLALREMGALGVVSRRYDVAVESYLRAVKMDPTDRASQGYLGCALISDGKNELGKRFLNRAGAGPWTVCALPDNTAPIARSDAETHALLGLALLTRGRYVESLHESKDALRIDRNRDDAHDDAGEALLNLGQLGASEAEFRTAIWLRPDEAEYHFDLARALAAQRRLAEAIAEAREAQRRWPGEARYEELLIQLQARIAAKKALWDQPCGRISSSNGA